MFQSYFHATRSIISGLNLITYPVDLMWLIHFLLWYLLKKFGIKVGKFDCRNKRNVLPPPIYIAVIQHVICSIGSRWKCRNLITFPVSRIQDKKKTYCFNWHFRSILMVLSWANLFFESCFETSKRQTNLSGAKIKKIDWLTKKLHKKNLSKVWNFGEVKQRPIILPTSPF